MKQRSTLWGTTNLSTSELLFQYTASEDTVFDQQLIPYDIYGSLAHAQMLATQKLITNKEYSQIKKVLTEIHTNYAKGKFHLKPTDEDVHTRLEQEITNIYSQAGQSVHIGRSRNDQVLVTMRLYTKHQLIELALAVLTLASFFQQLAKKNTNLPMVGYTHMQPGMLSSYGLWLHQFVESLLNDLELLAAAYQLNDQSPLGSGAGYGVSLPLDRKLTQKLLGFSKLQTNAIYCQNSRGKIEAFTVHVLSQVMATLNKFATDSLLFSMPEFGYFTFSSQVTTGSSIMPQKRNLDGLELVRAKSKEVTQAAATCQLIALDLPSGYNRDFQQIKKQLVTSFHITQSSVALGHLYISNLLPNKEAMKKNISQDIFAAEWTYQLMKERDIPFREAYQFVKRNLEKIPDFDSQELIAKATSLGSTGSIPFKLFDKTLKNQTKKWHKHQKDFSQIIESLLKETK